MAFVPSPIFGVGLLGNFTLLYLSVLKQKTSEATVVYCFFYSLFHCHQSLSFLYHEDLLGCFMCMRTTKAHFPSLDKMPRNLYRK